MGDVPGVIAMITPCPVVNKLASVTIVRLKPKGVPDFWCKSISGSILVLADMCCQSLLPVLVLHRPSMGSSFS